MRHICSQIKVIVCVSALIASSVAYGQLLKATWYASKSLDHSGQTATILLTDIETEVPLNDGRICRVGEVSKSSAYLSRVVTCSKGEDVVEFSVQCEASVPKDHTQLRFTTQSREPSDFIEVGCELSVQ